MKNRLVLRVLLLVACTLPAVGPAEYWLSNRLAQNCAACHAPGRINRRPPERRCTLSCQGCHVNPNGGGLVNSYGEWAQQRWLHSFYVEKLFTNKPRPAPFAKQMYGKSSGQSPPAPVAGSKGKAKSLLPSPVPTAASASPVLLTTNDRLDEREYDRSDQSEKITAEDQAQFLERVPPEDPYYTERSRSLFGGGHFRYMLLDYFGTPPTGFSQVNGWPMAVDVGVRIKPIPEHFNLVFEGRYLNQPQKNGWDQVFTNEARIRSAYALFDQFPYNSYLMYGIYRPMFGLYSPDHDALSSLFSGLRQRSIYKAVGIGAAPNVPFFNFNLITPFNDSAYDQSKGFVLNLGGRWVTMGASLVLSLWKTNFPDSSGNRLNRTMIALAAGAVYRKFVLNMEILYVNRESAPGTSDSGTVYTGQLKYQIWRESYLEANVGFGNTATSLRQGASGELAVGWRGFLLAGTDLEVLLVHRNNSTPTTSVDTNYLQAQIHLFL